MVNEEAADSEQFLYSKKVNDLFSSMVLKKMIKIILIKEHWLIIKNLQ